MALDWRQKRKTLIEVGVTILVLAFLAVLIVPRLGSAPSCFDGEQNGDERGIDCGGSCRLFCSNEVSDVSVRWYRVFPVAGNFYNAVAYIENQNVDAGLPRVAYEFKFYDEDNIFIKDYQGQTFVGPGQSAIFAGPIDLEGKVPKRVVFNFVGEKSFLKIGKEAASFGIFVNDRKTSDLESRPKLSARASNRSDYSLRDVEFVAILYNASDNTINVSKTVLEKINAGEDQEIFFTWPQPLEEEVVRIEILPRINPFLLSAQIGLNP